MHFRSLWFGVLVAIFDSNSWLAVNWPKDFTGNSSGRWSIGWGRSRRNSHCSFPWLMGTQGHFQSEELSEWLCGDLNFWTEGKWTGPRSPKVQNLASSLTPWGPAPPAQWRPSYFTKKGVEKSQPRAQPWALIFNFALDLLKLQGGLDSTPQPNPPLDQSLVFNSFVFSVRRSILFPTLKYSVVLSSFFLLVSVFRH